MSINRGYVTGFHLIPGRDDEVLIYLTKNTYGAGYRINPLCISLDGKPFTSISDLVKFIVGPLANAAIGTANGIDRETEVGTDNKSLYVCDSIDLSTIPD